MAVRIKRIEEGAADGKDASLRNPEVTEFRLHWDRPDRAEVLTLHDRFAGRYEPDTQRISDKSLTVGRAAGQA